MNTLRRYASLQTFAGLSSPGFLSLRTQFHLRPCPQKPRCVATDPRDLKVYGRICSVPAKAKAVVRYHYF